MTTLDLRGGPGGTLRLAPNGGSATMRSFLVLGPKGDKGDPGKDGTTAAKGDKGDKGDPGPPLPADQMTALSALYAGRNDVKSTSFIDFTTKADGAAPTALDSGQAVTLQGGTPTISGGKLIGAPTTTSSYADYFQWDLGGVSGKRVWAKWVVPSGTDDNNGTTCIALWHHAYRGSAVEQVPESRCHFTVNHGTHSWGYWVGDGAGHLIQVKGGNFTKPPADNVTPWRVDIWIDEDNGIAYVTLPDDSVITVTDAEQQAAMTAAGVASPKTFKNLAGGVAMIEHFATGNGTGAILPRFLSAGADTVYPDRGLRVASSLSLMKATTYLKSLLPPLPTFKSYQPGTRDSVALTGSALELGGTALRQTVTFPSSGRIKAEYVFHASVAAASQILVRVYTDDALSANVGAWTPLGDNPGGGSGAAYTGPVRTVGAITGTPGSTVVLHFTASVLIGSATAFAHGTWGIIHSSTVTPLAS